MSLFYSLLIAVALLLPPSPEKTDTVTALTNARIVTVTQGTIERGTILIQDGTIIQIGVNVDIPKDSRVIDLTGLSIYPGMIDSGTQMGLIEVGSLPETRDASELGDLSPQMKALIAVNPNGVAIPVTRISGVTTVLTVPSGGMLPGQAALINLHGYTPLQMFAGFEGIILRFPATGRRGRFDSRSEEDIKKAADEAMKKLNDTWDNAELHHRIDSTYQARPEDGRRPEYVPSMEALRDVIRGEQTLIIQVNAANDILAAIEWVQTRGIGRVLFSGVAEGWRVADKIAEAGIPCLVGPVLSIPTRQSDRFDKAYKNAGLMHAAGVKIALRSDDTANARNLPFHAGFATAYGLPIEEALRAVTINPAEIFGVSDRLGSLEIGKEATLFVADGDPFETATKIHHVFIAGYEIPMESRHTQLYEEFLQRSPGLHKHNRN
ncbi:MAG: amidohydrolase family protein [Rhodothermaceae bacterium]|nr:amidohydrolase family protein [Rhodothermaceae bacterium]MXW34053.1 amidohydrolase family protein [Rhodothermaceae bacterium]MYC03446.1 amidohydrolase family protein [Rhodothermaceae bacterium]MYE63143.1 amidohydrolase family protein [Rhodothermaceae bacterium]MYI17024.1 amidohydrolase family protein [Rhodothermaceae bacterium]